MEAITLILAAGRGLRAGGLLPKQYEMCKKTRMLTYTIEAVLKSKQVSAILVVICSADIELYVDSIKTITDSRLLPYCLGGTERTDSVKLGLKALEKYNPKKVLIHDAARPFVSINLISNILKSLEINSAVTPVLPIFDAIWEKHSSVKCNMIIRPGPDRNNLLLAQTPQGFDYNLIHSAYAKSKGSALDDIAIAHKTGIRISTIIGEASNFKITSEEHLKVFMGIN